MNDLRYGLRSLLRNPAFAAVAILTLALAIGANTAMFSIFDSVLLRPLAYRQPEGLYVVQEIVPKFAQLQDKLPVSAHHFLQWRAHTRSFDSLSLVGTAGMSLTSGGDPQNLTIGRVSPSLFQQLGITPALGRTFTVEEDRKGRDQVLVLSHALWVSRFQSDRNVVGRKVLLDGSPYEVIGVLAAEPAMPKVRELVSIPLDGDDAQAWKPFGIDESELSEMGDFNYGCIARLKPGVTAAQALADLNSVEKAITASFAEKVDLYGSLTQLQQQITGPTSAGLSLLLAAGGAVILIVCVNVASLLLIKVNGRRREIAIRTAMGAGRMRLMRQLATESLLLAGIAGGFGVACAYWILRVVVLNAPANLPRVDEIHMDARVLAFAVLLSILTGLACGLLPAFRFARVDANEALKANSRSVTEGRHGRRLRNLLVSLEVGLSVVALVVSGLLLNSFVRLLHVDKGFQTDRITTVTLNLPPVRYGTEAKKDEFLRTLIDRVQQVPGVSSSGVASMLPVSGEGMNNLAAPEGAQIPLMERPLMDFRSVSPGYLHALGIPLLEGRIFEERDRRRDVALLSISAARRLWPEGGAMGKKLHLGDDQSPVLEVIGVLGDVHGVSLQAPPNPTVYLPYWTHQWRPQISVVARTGGDPRSIAGAIRSEIRAIDAELPVPQFVSMEEIVDSSVAQRRFQLRLILLFGVASVLLSTMGVYGVVAFAVSQRTSEMGLRMVLGAKPSSVQAMVWRQGMIPVAFGIGSGLMASLALSRLLTGLLFGVPAADPVTFGAVAAILAVATGAACYIPALRATRVDPAIAMRYE
jgi:predicted permease